MKVGKQAEDSPQAKRRRMRSVLAKLGHSPFQNRPLLDLKQNLRGSADCEPTSESCRYAALLPETSAPPLLPRWGRLFWATPHFQTVGGRRGGEVIPPH